MAYLGVLGRSHAPSLSAGNHLVKVKQSYRFNFGFTLIELMITVTVVAILAAIAIPSYRQYIIRGNRSAAESVMMDLANREQQFLLATLSYADTTALTANGYSLPSDVGQNYTWAVTVRRECGRIGI